MLLEFSCSNHKSIKDKITFSMIAGKDNSDEDRLMSYDKYRVNRSSVIYGANGSGKSNFVDAIAFVKFLVLNSIQHQPGQGIRQIPHKLLGVENDSTYLIQFVKNDIRYAYGFTLNKTLVTDEYLFSYPKGRQMVVFERDSHSFSAGDRFKGKYDTCKDVLKPNRLFLSCAANFSAVKEIEDVYGFFRDDLVVYKGLGTDNWLTYSLNVMSEDKKMKSIVIDFMRRLGTGIKDIDIKHSKRNVDGDSLPPFLSDAFKADLLNKQFHVFDTKIVYDQFEVELQEESTGIRKLLEFICPLVDILSKDKILVCDELEANFHESLVYGFADLFRKKDTDSKSQLLFTTHDTSILDLSLFRRDQIWFSELTKDCRATDLYSLAEIKNVRKDENVSRGYIAGKYGAIPMLNENLVDALKVGKD